MGIDFLDLAYTIEKNNRLAFDKRSMDDFTRAMEDHEFTVKGCFRDRVRKGDWRVGRFFEVMRDHMGAKCTKCGTVILRQAGPAACQNCGEMRAVPELTWDQFCASLGEVLQVSPAKISRDLWLMGDLGFN